MEKAGIKVLSKVHDPALSPLFALFSSSVFNPPAPSLSIAYGQAHTGISSITNYMH
jgi:hypothetical protein